VRSPTYTLLQLFEVGPRTLVHLDLYRLEDPGELEPLALREWARPGCLWLIEWPERGAGFLPPPDLIVSLTAGADAHQAELRAGTATGENWLRRLAAAGSESRHG
jgi:tRNA threonylcarbamoyladenosine biosynthesis protein TsaE